MERVYIGLGSNMGDRLGNLRQALAQLAAHVTIEKKSSVYESEPMYLKAQPRFFNMAIGGSTSLTPRALLEALRGIEKRLGRLEAVHNGPRPIDLDILLYGDLVMDEPTLTIPHPRMHERAFVIVPMSEIAPLMPHPALGTVFADIEASLGSWGDDVRHVTDL
jgi:2-amino-4-hydroxy-6-hydroxymethyldihydropteridine diphosphokinase